MTPEDMLARATRALRDVEAQRDQLAFDLRRAEEVSQRLAEALDAKWSALDPEEFERLAVKFIGPAMRDRIEQLEAEVEKMRLEKAEAIQIADDMELKAIIELQAQQALEVQRDQLAIGRQHLEDAFTKFVAYAMTCKKNNEPGWMAEFARRINAASAALGGGDCVEWPGKSWANEFHYIMGEDPK